MVCCRCLNSLSASLPGAPYSFSLGQPSVVLGLLLSASSREQLTRESDKYLLAKALFRWLASNLNYWEGLLGAIVFQGSCSLLTTHLGGVGRKWEQRRAPQEHSQVEKQQILLPSKQIPLQGSADSPHPRGSAY